MTKIAIVTGASRGLGRSTALGIARHGGDVILTYQSDIGPVIASLLSDDNRWVNAQRNEVSGGQGI